MASKYTEFFARITLVLFSFFLIYYFWVGLSAPVVEIDSIHYHIPVAKSILDGTFLKPNYWSPFGYFPASNEIILAFFILLKIPLGLFNWFGVSFLALALYGLGRKLFANQSTAIIYAVSFATLNGVLRWINVQTVDIWLAVFYTAFLAKIVKPLNKDSDYLLFGIFAGMVVGGKYTGVPFALFTFVLFWKNYLRRLNFRRFLCTLVPVLALGGTWYFRNFAVKNNPFFPLHFWFLHGFEIYLNHQTWRSVLLYPKSIIDAFISEYMGWVLLPLLSVYYLAKKGMEVLPTKLIVLGLMNLFIYLFLPSTPNYQTHVSTWRYTYPAFIPLMAAVFLYFEKLKKVELLALVTLANIAVLLIRPYHPKLLFLLVPALYFFYSKLSLRAKT